MLITSSKINHTKIVDSLIKKHKLKEAQARLLKDVVAILPVCKNNYQHYGVDKIESFFVYPILLNQQLSIYEDNELKAFVTYALLDRTAEREWLTKDLLITYDKWKSGDNFWIIDAFSPWGHGRKLMTELEFYLSKNGHKAKIIRYKRNYPNGKSRINQSII